MVKVTMMMEIMAMTVILMTVTTYTFSPIKVVVQDVAGVVKDGPDTLVDIDYQLDLSTVTVTFSGFESKLDGVTRYEWAVGSAPRLDDVMPYSYVNLVTDDEGASGMLGKTTLKTLSSLSVITKLSSVKIPERTYGHYI